MTNNLTKYLKKIKQPGQTINCPKLYERRKQMDKNSFLIYLDYQEQFDLLTDEQIGQLMRAIMQYEKTGEIIELDGMVKMAFSFIKTQLDRDREKTRIGKYHWNWKGGVRNCTRYKEWRKQVFERDNYTCQICKRKNTKLNAHHIEKFSVNKLKRFDVNNGITLCEECHRRIHKNEE